MSPKKDMGLKKLSFNNKMPTFSELMAILKDNQIKGYPHYTKTKRIDLLVKRGLYLKILY